MNNLQLLPADTDAATQAAHLAEMMRLHSEIRKAVVMAAQGAMDGDVNDSLDFNKGYDQGYNDATREVCLR